jgi:nucleoside-diphosphate-sugar epimerase
LGVGQTALEGVVTASGWPAKILVTGNMGYVGPVVVGRLRESYPDASLVGLDAGYFAHLLTGCSVMPERNLDCQYFGDVRAIPFALLEGVDAVVHLAAISNDPIGNAYDEVTLSVNHEATRRLAREAKAAGARSFVFAGSCSIYGVSCDAVATEDSPAKPLTRYAESKWLAEKSLEDLADDTFTVTSLRFGTACGMSDRLRLDVVLNDFVASAIATKTITLLSDGMAWRPLIHVADMARAIDWGIGRDRREGGPFLAINVGSNDWNYRVRELADEVARAIPGVDVSLAGSGEPDRRSYRVSFELYEALAPDHRPQVGIQAAIEGLKEGLERMGFADPEFRSSPLMRLLVLQDLRKRALVNDRLEWTTHADVYAAAR